MMGILLLVLIISANCVKMNCEEEPGITENFNGALEKAESFSADPEKSKSRTEENTENEDIVSKTSDDSEEMRISRSSSESSLENESPSVSLTEKSTHEEIKSEPQGRESDTDAEQLTRGANSTTEEDRKSSENVEKQLEELPETSRSASEIQDRKTEDLSEASSESKLSDNEKASSKLHDTSRNSETEEENSNESGLNESRGHRRMFSAPDNIVIDVKMRTDSTSTAVKPEAKTALNQNLNTYNLNEFGTNRNNKLTDSAKTEPSYATAKTNIPVLTNFATQEILNQRHLPKFYPRPELGMSYPNVNSDFQGPRDLPVYLKVKQDEFQAPNHFTGAQMPQFKSAQENTYFNPRNQQQYNQPQRSPHTQETFTNKQYENLQVESRIQAPQLYQNQVPKDLRNFIQNKQLLNLNQGPRNQIPQLFQNQEKMNPNYNNFGDLHRETLNEETQESSRIPVNNNHRGNQYPLFNEPELIIESRINLDKNQFGAEPYPNSYSNVRYPAQASGLQQINVLNVPKNKVDIIPTNVKTLFQKLASASFLPGKLTTHYLNNHIQNYPHFTAGFPVYDLNFIPSCC